MENLHVSVEANDIAKKQKELFFYIVVCGRTRSFVKPWKQSRVSKMNTIIIVDSNFNDYKYSVCCTNNIDSRYIFFVRNRVHFTCCGALNYRYKN